MKNSIYVLFSLILLSCNTQPQPLIAGRDECSFCKMPVADTKFGAEIITQKGKLYKFDDIGCMINFLKAGLIKEEKVKNLFVVNYSDNQKFLNVNEAVFLKSPGFRTPMNSEIAALASHSEAKSLIKDFPGELLTWKQLQ